ncbi:DUF2514 family protein [Pseudomonas sp. LFM046]|uniref:DUF2514 family protein n=1 Tax=Pseudomonas sp. LFM046 TaxID=1608357 RepID=UPI0005CFC033|nr:DUF2514 family protein [Pseudomonas sp. LFM046]
MGWVKELPAWSWWLLALVLVAGLQQLRIADLQVDVASANAGKVEAEKGLSDYRLEVAERDRRAGARARAEEQRRQRAADEVDRDAKGKLEAAQADAAAAESAADRLQLEVDRLRAGRGATCSAIAAQQRAAGLDAFGVLADLFASADRRAGELAAALDRSRVAGLACERAYEALLAPPAKLP